MALCLAYFGTFLVLLVELHQQGPLCVLNVSHMIEVRVSTDSGRLPLTLVMLGLT